MQIYNVCLTQINHEVIMPWFSAAQPAAQASAVHNSLPTVSVQFYIFDGVYLTTLSRAYNRGLVRDWRIIKYVTRSCTGPASQIPDICLEALRNPRSTLSQVERIEIWTRHRPNTKQEPSDRGVRRGSTWYKVRIPRQTESNWFVSSTHGRSNT